MGDILCNIADGVHIILDTTISGDTGDKTGIDVWSSGGSSDARRCNNNVSVCDGDRFFI